MKKVPDYEEIARMIMFNPKGFSLAKFDITFRKGKTTSDINTALRKALKTGMGTTEYELSMFELYIKDVFKGI